MGETQLRTLVSISMSYFYMASEKYPERGESSHETSAGGGRGGFQDPAEGRLRADGRSLTCTVLTVDMHGAINTDL